MSALVEKYPQLAAFAKSHIATVHILSTTHPKDRAEYYLAESAPMLSAEQMIAFDEYCEVCATTVLNAMAESGGAKDTGSNECTLFVGDLWDGRLLVFLMCNGTTRPAVRQQPDDFEKPFAIKVIFVLCTSPC